jgi:Ca2+-transporting ATPase
VVWLLLGAGAIAAALGQHIDGGAILAIVLLNALIGFVQEHRAERAVAALANLTAPRARVVRDGRSASIPAREVVRGDLLVLEGGDLVAADAQLLDAASLHTNEAPLTGESELVRKDAVALAVSTPLSERRNQVFLGTSVATGSGRALVFATGMSTEVGHIATLLESASSSETPLQRKLDRVAQRLVYASLAIVAVVFALGWLRGTPLFELFISAVSLAVAAVPEGLPAVVTVALALGVERMARRRALVRRLPAVETLGSAQVICSDKTGTLTVGAMTVRRIVTASGVYSLTGEGYDTRGALISEARELSLSTPTALLRAAAACNEAELVMTSGAKMEIAGDPTEAALLVAAAKAGLSRERIEAEEPRLRALPFDSDRKRMSTVRRREGRDWLYAKGAPETILERCTRLRTEAGTVPFDAAARERFREAAALLAAEALRVLAVAERDVTGVVESDLEQGLTFLGFAAMQDPPRAEAREAVAKCRRAGIQTVMITGDHPETGRAIAAELGILAPGDELLVGADLDRMDDEELANRVLRTRVYARVTAEHKLRIVRAWKQHGCVVAMTGDGVNDAPALREASIGIAMGITGTEVAKQAADIVIADDDFASIVAAVEEGRGIFDNIAETLSYLLAGNAGELILMLAAALAGYPAPLLPIQLLWINLVTDGLPALALATDPIDASVLDRPPRRTDAELADRVRLFGIALTGCLTAAVAFGVYAYEMQQSGDAATARNGAFSTLVFAELLRSFGARSDDKRITEIGLFSNLRLVAIVAGSLLLQVWIHQSPALARLFGTQPISLSQGLAWIALGAVPLFALEVRKWLLFRAHRGQ